MSHTMLTQHDLAVKAGQFVAPTADAQYDADFAVGRKAYRSDKRRSWCSTDAMRDGWDDAASDGADDFWRGMMAQASTQEAM